MFTTLTNWSEGLPTATTTTVAADIMTYDLLEDALRTLQKQAHTLVVQQATPRREPIWVSQDGHEYYTPTEISDYHLLNIYKYHVARRRVIPDWLRNELNYRMIRP